MSTQAQILANRENAQKSTGPTTDEGKETSARNNTQHGLAAKKFTHKTFFLFENEDMTEYLKLVAQLVKEYDAAEGSEYMLCEQMAQSSWLRSRALRLQTSCYNQDFVVYDKENFELYVRYQNTHDRHFNRSLNNLLKVKAIKAKAQIGFESHLMAMASIATGKIAQTAPKTPPNPPLSGRNYNFYDRPTSQPTENTETKTENTVEIDPGGVKQAA